MARTGGYWREAATIVIAAKTLSSQSEYSESVMKLTETRLIPFDYQVLMLKRSKKNAFLPENYVFPGGTISDADFDAGWIQIFEHFTKDSIATITGKFRDRHEVAPMFIDRPASTIPAEIAFRICALRECFEECGILLVRSLKHCADDATRIVTSSDLNNGTWRKRVHGDAMQFLGLCLENKLVPDIWCLYEWCNWLTPSMEQVTEPPKRPHRFDTMFYVCCLDSQPEARVDNRETTTAQWQNPGYLLDLHYKGKIQMISPQLLELSRFCNFSRVAELREFARRREVHGVQRWMPVGMPCQDGVIILLPGDGLYPEDPDYEGKKAIQSLDHTMSSARAATPHWNRSQRAFQGHNVAVHCNVAQPCGQVAPVEKIHLDGVRL